MNIKVLNYLLIFLAVFALPFAALAVEGLPSLIDKFPVITNPAEKSLQEQEDLIKRKQEPKPSLSLPDAEPLQQQGLPSDVRVFVKQVKFTGHTVFTAKELGLITSPYENRVITFEELETLRLMLTKNYIDRGYINSGVIIPDQQIVDGVIHLQVIEGTLSEIEIEGLQYFREFYINRRLQLGAQPPLNIDRLREALENLQQDQRIKRIKAQLGPSVTPGESILKVNVDEYSPYKASVSFGNNSSPSVGAYRGEVTLSHRNLTGMGDILEGRYGLTEGTGDYALFYSLPVTSHDTIVDVHWRKSNNLITEESFKPLDIRSRSEMFGFTIGHPFYKTLTQALRLSLTLDMLRNETYLFNQPFSFSDNEDNVTRETVVRFAQEWTNRSPTEVLSLRSQFSLGIDAFGATINDTGVDGRFLSWLGQMLWIKQFSDPNIQTVLRTDMQFSDDSLLPMERFSVGGINSVRGYRENQLVRDNGIVSSIEARLPVVQDREKWGALDLATFFDFGWSQNRKKETQEPAVIASVGVGLRWSFRDMINCQLYVGHPLNKVDHTDRDIQDGGIHFQLTWQML